MGGVVQGLSSFIGGRQANEAQQEDFISNQQFNASQAQLQRNWEQQMSSTAWQRGVADMKAAGINPLLAVQTGGASTPGGAAASSSGTPQMRNALGEGMQALMQGQQTSANVDLAKKQGDLADAQSNKAASETNLNKIQAGYTAQQLQAEIDKANSMTENFKRQAELFGKQAGLTQANMDQVLTDNQWRNEFDRLTNVGISLNNQRLKLGMPELQADNKFWTGPAAAMAAAAKAAHQGTGALGGITAASAQGVAQGLDTARDWTSRTMENIFNAARSFLPQGHWTNK